MGFFVSPAEVSARMDQIDGGWSQLAMDASRGGGAGMQPTLNAFQSDLSTWKKFYQANYGAVFSAASVNDALDSWTGILNSWRAQLKAIGIQVNGLPVPIPQAPPDTIASTVRWGALAVIAVAVAYAVGPVIRRAAR